MAEGLLTLARPVAAGQLRGCRACPAAVVTVIARWDDPVGRNNERGENTHLQLSLSILEEL